MISTDEPHRAHRRWSRKVFGSLVVALGLGAGAGVLVHWFGPVSTSVTLLASFSPLFIVVALVTLTLAMAARWWVLAVASLLIVTAGVAAQLPLYVADGGPAAVEEPRIRLLQANIQLGEANARELVTHVRSNRVDVLTVAELTEEAVDRLAAVGIADMLPYSFVRSDEGGSGAGIYSRYPLTDTSLLPGLEHNNLRATVQLDHAQSFAVYALHPIPPYPEPAWRWAHELDRLGTILADERLPLIIGADFNSTFDHWRYRKLVKQGEQEGRSLVDAADYLGSGIVATYPADRWFPPVLAIDRILSRGATPVSFERVELPGSDHYGVLAELQVDPPSPD